MAPLTPILSLISRFSQGSLWPKVDRGGCRETEEPLCADEELEPRGSFQDNFVTFLEAFSSAPALFSLASSSATGGTSVVSF